MTAAAALRSRKQREARPAEPAHDSVVICRYWALARDTCPRKQQVERTFEAIRKRARARDPYSADRRIASLSGSFPNHLVYESAPCSSSISIPSRAPFARARRDRTLAVSPRL